MSVYRTVSPLLFPHYLPATSKRSPSVLAQRQISAMDSPGNLTADGEALARWAAQQLYDAGLLTSPAFKVAILLAGAAMVVAVVSYGVAGLKPLISSRKAQQVKAMREAYKSMETQASLSNIKKDKVNQPQVHGVLVMLTSSG